MKTTILAITGASASGKSLFSSTIYRELADELGKDRIAIISEDSYYKRQDHLLLEERIKTNYDHPDAFEHDLLSQHLQDLRGGKSVEVPQYCYKSHNRTEETNTVKPVQVLLVEGIMLLTNPQLVSQFDIKVFMDTPLDICLVRRIKRDMEERDRNFDSVVEQYIHTVRPMYKAFIEPSKQHADVIVTRGGQNRTAIEILKAKIRQLLNQ
ncbi:uridine kinase [Flocculibacter collagenilyticus]|uniref:uridine kinase n=1 Tax=Flocculibacter collagenilyticus TaxID=2744479 RepID=UPI0018F310C3|nr:uridine kinase [Flocculibacter collagenilyticus]